jgi:alpha-mannosidase
MPVQILSRGEGIALTEAPRAYPRADRVAEACALGWVDDMPGYSLETRLQSRSGPRPSPRPVEVDGLALDNGLVRVSVTPDGDVQLADPATGRKLRSVLSFQQQVEAGDLYTPAQRETLPPPRISRVRPTLRGPLRGEIALRFAFGSRGRGRGHCDVRLQLDAGSPLLRIRLRGENEDGDQRLRLCIATGMAGAATMADAAFRPVRREPLMVPESEQHTERVVTTAPLHRWVTRFGVGAGVTVFSDGLAEYESLDDGTVALTLFRAVGELSRADLPERPGHAGWPAPTPGAQARGVYQALVAVAMHGGDDWRTVEQVERLADDLLLPLRGETIRYNLDDPHRAGGLELDGEGVAFSAAMPARAAEWMVLRCVNRRAEATHGQWRIARPVTEAMRARLDETPIEPLAVRDGRVEFDAEPHEIVTILVR